MSTPETALNIEVVAVSTVAFVAKAPPPVNVSSVNLRVAAPHTSVASEPKEVRVLAALVQTALAIVLVEVTYVPSTINVLSTLIKSPTIADPQDIVTGHGPSAAFPGTEYVYACQPVVEVDMLVFVTTADPAGLEIVIVHGVVVAV